MDIQIKIPKPTPEDGGMDYKNLLVTVEPPIATVTINRPSVLNALDDETIAELWVAFLLLEKNDGVRVILLTGAGEKAFAAGADINELRSADVLRSRWKCEQGQGLLFKVEEMDKAVTEAIAETGISSPKMMGVVMKAAQAKLTGKRVDGKILSDRVRARLT